MDKKIILRDYSDLRKEFTIKDFENVKSIYISIISGDEVAEIVYKDGKFVNYDSSDERIMNYYDTCYELPLDLIDEFSAFEGDSYECERYIDELVSNRLGDE